MGEAGWARLLACRLLPGAVVIALVAAISWAFHTSLGLAFQQHPALLPATAALVVILAVAPAVVLRMEEAASKWRWLMRSKHLTGLADMVRPPLWLRLVRRLPDPFEWLFQPTLRTSVGRRWAGDWTAAGLGTKPSRYFLLLAFSALAGWMIAVRVAGVVLGVVFAFTFPILPFRLVANRAAAHRRRFGEQLPQALDAMAAGLSAGLSFQQAVDFARQEVPHPMAATLTKLHRRMLLGYSVGEALHSALDEHSDQSLALVVEGIELQRQFGGDLVRMLQETSGLLRERVELEREVRAVTVQGRLSGAVIAALLPVSVGILLLFNPHYVDVLFDTLIGQAMLVLALLLQLAGWALISRMTRFRY